METEVDLDGRKVIVKELTFDEGFDKLANRDRPQKEIMKDLIRLSVKEFTEDDITKLSMKDALKLISAITELNGFTENFTLPKTPV